MSRPPSCPILSRSVWGAVEMRGKARGGAERRRSVPRTHHLAQLLRRQVLERASLVRQGLLEPQGDLVEFGRVDPPGDLDQFGRVHLVESLPAAIELRLESEHGLEHLGMRLRRTSEQEALLAG